jgi:signal transduction histidine kinase
VSVRDNGMGLAPEVLPHVFELFVQAEEGARGGLGIGLNLVQSLVRMHGGSVSVTSEGPGKGSEFEVRLPLAGGRLTAPDGVNRPDVGARGV